jgi:carbon-monoxide dehydrogenase large subunit
VWQAVRDAETGTLPDPWRDPPEAFATLPLRGDGPQGPSIDP